MLTFLLSLAIMLAVVGVAMKWAEREHRRRNLDQEGHARHHR